MESGLRKIKGEMLRSDRRGKKKAPRKTLTENHIQVTQGKRKQSSLYCEIYIERKGMNLRDNLV